MHIFLHFYAKYQLLFKNITFMYNQQTFLLRILSKVAANISQSWEPNVSFFYYPTHLKWQSCHLKLHLLLPAQLIQWTYEDPENVNKKFSTLIIWPLSEIKVRYDCLRTNKNVYVLPVSRPNLGVCSDPKHFIVKIKYTIVRSIDNGKRLT